MPRCQGEAARNGITGLFDGSSPRTTATPMSILRELGQAGLGMPDRDMYLLNEPNLVSLRAAYLDHLTKMLTLAGESNAAARAKAILNFETAIAKVSWTREDVGDATKTYNKMSLAQLAKLAPGFDWATYLKARGANVSELLVAEPSAFKAIAALSTKRRCTCSGPAHRPVARHLCRRPAESVTDENFAFYGTKLNGTPENQPRWKRAVDFTTNTLDDDVSKLYVTKWFPPESKAAMDKLVGNIIAAMGRRIDNLTWMAPETKVKAKAKLAAFTPRIGYPDQWHDYTFDVQPRRSVRQCAARQPMGERLEHPQARPADLPLGVGVRPDDHQRPGQFQVGRDHLPGGDPPAAVLRSQCRPGDQLWRDRRRHRPRNEPSLRRSGLQI